MRSQIERAINLAAKTGDKIIVVDELNDRSSVVMSLDEYEKLLNSENKGNKEIENLTEEELLDKINRDIVIWREANKDKNFLEEIDGLGDDIEDENDADFSLPDEDLANDEDSANEEESLPGFTDIVPDIVPDVETESVSGAEEKDVPEEKEEVSEENLYYYNEPSSAIAAEGGVGNNEDSGFTSIKDELKRNKKAWEIPAEVKQAAEDVRI